MSDVIALGTHSARELTEAEWAYLAGIIDGEGYIFARTYRGLGPHQSCGLTVTSTCWALMEWLVTRLGGAVRTKPKREARYLDSWEWRVSRQTATVILTAVRPYLVVKGVEADLFMEYAALVGLRGGYPVSPEVSRRRVLLAEALASHHGGQGVQRWLPAALLGIE